MSRAQTPPRRRGRILGHLTAATLGAASLAAAPADAARGDLTAPDNPDDDVDPRHLAAAHWLAVSLERMDPLTATHTACAWALSPDPGQRLTMAGALEWIFPLLGERTILDHLSLDPDPMIRAAIARAAWARHAAAPRASDQVLHRLAADDTTEVREIARLALRGR